MITPLFVFLFIQNEIVREKEYKLRQGLNIFGASHTAYWISWFLITLIYSLICSVASYLAGLSFGFGFFADTPFYIIILMLLFPFNLALAMIGFLVATLAPNAKASNTVSYAIVLLAIVVQSFVSDNNLLTFIFTSNASSLVSILRAFLVIYPPFSFTKVTIRLFRSLPTLLYFQDTTSTSHKGLGSQALIRTIGRLSSNPPQGRFPSEAEHSTAIRISSPCSSSMLMLHSTLCLLGIATTLSLPTEEEANRCFSPFTAS